jgi:hypothetical protein
MRKSAVAVLSSVGVVSGLLALPHVHAQALRTLSTDTKTVTANSICGHPIPAPQVIPPTGSGPVVYLVSPCFARQGGRPRLEPGSYLKNIQLKPSRPSAGMWTPYDAAAERVILEDFQRLWDSHPLTDLTIEVQDYRFSNGVVGKLVVYDMLERN